MTDRASPADKSRFLACIALYWVGAAVWWLLVLFNLSGRGGWLWTPLRELMFGQGVFLDHFTPVGQSRLTAVLLWLGLELAGVTAVALLLEPWFKKGRRSCWLRALIGAGLLQVGLYGLGAMVGE